ncbi:hypothetical protein AB0M20_01090 [Actinoplanes sp. NPDC051633]|uniref:hypothetical protein n=1 Tax=Actinoplanes sp. NPDC051633 TaxID=3155670 RepID=UPI003435158E
MKRELKSALVVATAVALATGGTLVAYAWEVPSKTVQAKLRAAKMPRGIEPSVAPRGATALVTWSSQEVTDGVTMTDYVITAHSVDTPAKQPVAHKVAAAKADSQSVVFTAAELAGGSWRWTLTPKLHSWTGAESPRTKKLTFPEATAADLLVSSETPADVAPSRDSANTTTPSTTSPSSSAVTESKPAAATETSEPTKDPEPTAEPEETRASTEPPAVVEPSSSESSKAAADDKAADK